MRSVRIGVSKLNRVSYLRLHISLSPQQETSLYLSYRNLALKYHPQLKHANPNEAYHLFCQAAEAFDVLYDSLKRQIYDEKGLQELKSGLLDRPGQYKLTTDPQEIFEKFFGSKNVYEHLLEEGKEDGKSHQLFKSQYKDLPSEKKVEDLIVPVPCSLTELFNGCEKTLTYHKKTQTANGRDTTTITETKVISIPPGSSSNHPIVFSGQGNKEPGYRQSDLVFKICETDQKGFKRQGDNLLKSVPIKLADALLSKSISITQLNGNVFELHFDEIISPATKRTVTGKGMLVFNADPSSTNAPAKRGDLIVSFNILFPEELAPNVKKELVSLLKDSVVKQ